MAQPPGYPKRIWLFLQAEVHVVDGREEIVSTMPVASTTDENVANVVLAKFKERQSDETLIRSTIQPLTPAVAEIISPPNSKSILDEIAEETVKV